MENAHPNDKLEDGTRPDIRCYRTGNALVGIDLVSGAFHVEAVDMAEAIPVYNDLFVFRGLSEDDLKNFDLGCRVCEVDTKRQYQRRQQ